MRVEVGNTVIYNLTEGDINNIMTYRAPCGFDTTEAERPYKCGDEFPLLVTRAKSDNHVSGHAFLEGSNPPSIYVSHIPEGNTYGTWHWPPKWHPLVQKKAIELPASSLEGK